MADTVTRREFVAGAGGAGVAGLVIGGVVGYVAHGDSESSTSGPSAEKGKPLTVGAGVPVTGPFAGDGQEMKRGLELGADEINANGGVAGRPIRLSVLDTKAQQPDVMKNVVRRFVSDNVAAMFVPFCTYQSVEFPPAAAAGVPMFHVNTFQGNLDYVKSHSYTNIYEGCPSQIWYGSGFAVVVNDLITAKAWTPSSKSIAIVTSNDPYSLQIAQAFRDTMQQQGWKITMFEQFTVPQADWGTILVKIRQDPPGIIFFSDYTAGDEASFAKQFAQSPTQSLLYQQYAPSVPEYLQLAGQAANGVIWSTVIGTIEHDELGQKFVADYTDKFGEAPGLSNAGAQYDLIRLWAQAAALAGDPYDFKQVNANVLNGIFRGVSGAYRFVPGELAPQPYPDKVNDPSLGMPHLTFQIQDGKQVLISPAPYATGKFQLPGWLSQ